MRGNGTFAVPPSDSFDANPGSADGSMAAESPSVFVRLLADRP